MSPAEISEAMAKIVKSWDALPEGSYSPRAVEKWLKEDLAPAIKNARAALAAQHDRAGEAEISEAELARAHRTLLQHEPNMTNPDFHRLRLDALKTVLSEFASGRTSLAAQAPGAGVPETRDAIESVGQAIADAELGHHLKLVSLVDDVSTYSVKFDDGSGGTFDGIDAAYAHIAERRNRERALAAIRAINSLGTAAVGSAPPVDPYERAAKVAETWCDNPGTSHFPTTQGAIAAAIRALKEG